MELIAPTLVVLAFCALIAFIPVLIWRLILKKRTGPTYGEFFLVLFYRTVGLAFLGFVLGFFGPMVMDQGSAQGPMLGIFITGPLGALVGVVASWVWFYVRRKNP
jgi:hypothetical protein